MSRNKRIIILVTIVVMSILGIVGVFIYRNKNVDSIIGKNNNDQLQENTINDEKIILQNQVVGNKSKSDDEEIQQIQNKENIQVEEQKVNKQEVTPVEKQENKDKGIQQVQKKQDIQEKKDKVNEIEIAPSVEKENESKSDDEKKEIQQDIQVEEQKDSKENNDNIVDKEINNNDKPKCIHSNLNWYNSKEEAESIYNEEIKKWGQKWKNNEIDDETYYNNCPYGYETWKCNSCDKWTINLYYE